MSLTRITARFGGAQRNFELRIGEIAELERLCNAGVGEITARVNFDRHRYNDVRETIRLGLEGAGTSPPEADALVVRYVEGHPLADNIHLASMILSALHSGAAAINKALAGLGSAQGEARGRDGERPRPGDLSFFHECGHVLGLRPADVNAMDYHAFAACLVAHARMNADPNAPPAPPTDEEFRAAMAKYVDPIL